ncbi:polyketide synthase [Mycolicibacterium frederiksbergense]
MFIGGFTLDYQLLQNQGRSSRYRFKAHSATGMMMTMLANRISHAFDFRGPSMTIDTACSSSLVAVHLAAQSIWNGECAVALAGGVNIMGGPNTAIAESRSGFLSPEGRSKALLRFGGRVCTG